MLRVFLTFTVVVESRPDDRVSSTGCVYRRLVDSRRVDSYVIATIQGDAISSSLPRFAVKTCPSDLSRGSREIAADVVRRTKFSQTIVERPIKPIGNVFAYPS